VGCVLSKFEIPGFEILEKIGSGGMATVWKARQISLDRTVAIKVLSSHLSGEAEDVERFKKEAQAEAKLKHPGIVQVYDASVDAGSCYIVMEYVDGYTIGDWVRRKKRLSEEDALLVAGYVADALAYAWETAGIIHCDIKPDNVLIDADGTPKVTDLGLARTINAMKVERVSDEVMGTPAYMSPEQIQGITDLDCRTDIYSLGAMLYHLVTGTMLFQGEPDDVVMEKQLTGSVPSPLKYNDKLSPAICGLIEKMMAKDRNHRYMDWLAVRSDIARAKRHLQPVEPLVEAGLSTAAHTPLPKVLKIPAAARPRSHASVRPQHGSLAPLLATLCAGAVGVIAGVWVYGRLMDAVAPPVPVEDQKAAVVVAQSRTRAERMLQQAREWAASHPYDYDEAEARYRKVMVAGRGSEFALQARDDIRSLHVTRDEAIHAVMVGLDKQAEPLQRKRAWLEAAGLYLNYVGMLSGQTREQRESRAAFLRAEHEAAEQAHRIAEVESRQSVENILDDVAARLLEGGVSTARGILDASMAQVVDPEQKRDFTSLSSVLADAEKMDRNILDSFSAEVGQTIDVAMKDGRRELKIMGVVDGVVHARVVTSVQGVSVELSFGPRDLSGSERLARMGDDENQAVALAKGVMAWQAGAMSYAGQYFTRTHPLLTRRPAAAVDGKATADSEGRARVAMLRLLQSIGMPINGETYTKELAMIYLRTLRLSSSDAARLEAAVNQYRKQHGETAFGRDHVPVLQVIEQAAQQATATQRRFVTGVDSAGASASPDAIAAALQRANPGMAATDIETQVDNGQIVSMTITSGDLRDLRALGACTQLASLTLTAPGLRNLSGLSGLPLKSLTISKSNVSDLSPLRRMPLSSLSLAGAPVRDLFALSGMALTELDLSGTKVNDLRNLKEMPLTRLNLADSGVSSLPPLRSMPIQDLDVSGCAIKDVSFVSGSELKRLKAARTPLSSLSGLEESSVEWLDISETQVRDLDGLAGLALGFLNISNTRLSDLSPLRGLPLRSLTIDGTEVRDLKPLRSLPLVHLSCSNLAMIDYTPLSGMALESINVGDLRAVREILATMPNLVTVNGAALPRREGGGRGPLNKRKP